MRLKLSTMVWSTKISVTSETSENAARKRQLSQKSSHRDVPFPYYPAALIPRALSRFLGTVEVPMLARIRLLNSIELTEMTYVWFQLFLMNSFHFKGGWMYYAYCTLPSTNNPLYNFALRATCARSLLPAQHWLLCHLGLYYFEFEFALGRFLGTVEVPNMLARIKLLNSVELHSLNCWSGGRWRID